ncbi:phosphoadenylyl-sulfate reductase [Zoogloea oleivorans]|uniref:Adenosine 5'-phosphosulfate reductase n=1 Tax=Zoogloea oleivorans TaxID=1552750 RepID=A0A6C2CQ79_9RHOO|nr:phosphoadenylyl-sulfate reductase [Zoogloea oleivorans]TYC56011.1 phosphoadenylyl-sulfate reductase [Zoogloea oleivorans]
MHPNQNPKLDDPVLLASLEAKVAILKADLAAAAVEFPAITMANSLGAEDMVLTDVIATSKLTIEIFSLDTGRLPLETYDLMAKVQAHYGLKLKFYYPNHEAVEAFTRENGINGFYDSVALRKACCHARKVEPLGRALAGKQAWITGLRAEQSTTRTDLPKQQFDEGNGLIKLNPLSAWSEKEVWAYIRLNKVPYNALHDKFYPSIGCAPCTRPVSIGEDVRAGRWWWENPETKECGLHVKK